MMIRDEYPDGFQLLELLVVSRVISCLAEEWVSIIIF